MTVTGTRSVPTRLRRGVLRWVGRITAALGGLAAVCVACALPILLVGGGTAAFTEGLMNEARVLLPIGLALIALGVAYSAFRRRRLAGRAASPPDDRE